MAFRPAAIHARLGSIGLILCACLAIFRSDARAADTMDANAFGTFIDEQMRTGIARNDFPGAAVVLVQDGTVAFSRGYGVADVASGKPVDPLMTGFRVGSVSKLLTATAVLQLAQRGKIALHDEIQPYLADVALGDAGRGVTVHHLLTHTDGFDVGWPIGGATLDSRGAPSLAAFLQSHRPRRILPPGQMYVYSDVGLALAGHIVENVDGRPFARYVQQELLAPLGMTRSTFDQPLPPDIQSNLATGYRNFAGKMQATPFAHVLASPSAGLTTTAGDIARFMIACLDDGEIDGHRVLTPESTALMRTRQFSQHPALPGTAYGFHEHVHNGQTAFMHSGVMPGYHAIVLLLPAQHAGIFVVTNAYGDETFEPFVDALFDRFFPRSAAPTTTAPAVATAPPSDLSGRYRYVQYPHNNIAKLCILAGMVEEMRVRQLDDGKLIVDQGLKGPWTCAGPLLYVRGEEKLAFRQDDRGRTIGAAYDTWAFEKIRWYEGRRAQTLVIVSMVILFLIAPLVSLASRWRRRGVPALRSENMRTITCVINLSFLAGLSYSVWHADIFDWYFGLPRLLAALRYVPWISALLTLACLAWTARQISRPTWRLSGKCWHVMMLCTLVIFPIFCWYWNLLAWMD